MNRAGIVSIIIAALLIAEVLHAQEIKEEESLNYSYLGPALSLGYSRVEYSEWSNDLMKTREMTGYSMSAGAALNIFADNLCGDFQMKYAFSMFDYSVTNLEFSMSGKYYYSFNNYVSAGSGIGIYLEGPPSNIEHNGGAGIQLPVSLLLSTTPGSKLFIDVFFRYGSFGTGENTESISAGVNVGYIFKVGRI